jgi:RimJ/RimL family protein N-acetyltransferase
MSERGLQFSTDDVVTLKAPRDGDAQLLVQPGEVNVGYYLFPGARRKGYAARAVELLLLHLRDHTEHTTAALVIHRENVLSLRLAQRLGFVQRGELDRGLFFVREVGSIS